MGKLINFCAGADLRTYPRNQVEGLLLNVPDNGANETTTLNSHKLIKKLNPRAVILDSGGYQLLKAEEQGKQIICNPSSPFLRTKEVINLSPEHVIQAAEAIKPDILIGPDFPIRKLTDVREQQMEFDRKLSLNVEWAQKISWLRRKHSPSTKLFMPVQCYTVEQFDQFMDLIKGTIFEGLSMPARNLDLQGIVDFLLRFHELGLRRIHLLGVSSFFVFALCAYMARNLFDWVSMDSTTWRISAQFHVYLNSDNLSGIKVGENANIPQGMRNNCSCPWCQCMSFNNIQKLHSRQRRSSLLNHNSWVTENAIRKLYGNASDIATLVAFIKGKSSNGKKIAELQNALSYVDSTMRSSNEDNNGLVVNF